MRSILSLLRQLQRAFFIALALSITLLFLFPARSYAQAILLRSDPIQNALLNSAPTRVRMWFSDDLSPSNSTAMVVTPSNRRIDLHNAHISSIDTHEMDVALQPLLMPGTYSVLWTTQSADDGSVLRGSFIFSVTEPNGTVPKTNGPLPGQNNARSANNSNLLDGPTFFSFIMNTFAQLITTEYGRTLIVKSVLVAALMVTSGIHIGLLSPRLAKDYKKMMRVGQARLLPFLKAMRRIFSPSCRGQSSMV